LGQIFHRSTNTISRVTIAGAFVFAVALGWFLLTFPFSSYSTQAGIVKEQPIPFSHKHHVSDLGMDCRYCHTSVETSAFAGMPSTEICMNCHSEIWKDSPELAPVRDSFQGGQPIEWVRVDNLPGYAYFDHSIHVAKGVACVTCHGQVDEMPLTWQDKSLLMSWCVNCHRDPQPNIRPVDQVTNMNWSPPDDMQQLRRQLMIDYNVQSKTSCSTCHR
jgi:hypothetical protein